MILFNDKFTVKVMLADVVYIFLYRKKNTGFLATRHMPGG